MNITEYAIAKKLFGGGGGKREGTAIPVGEDVDKIYFNTNNTVEETDAILSQLTYIDIGIGAPVYPVYAKTADGNEGTFIMIVGVNNEYQISEVRNFAESIQTDYYYSGASDKHLNGWKPDISAQSRGFFIYPSAMSVCEDGQPLTDLQGIPIGTENEKIKNVLSITPF